MNNGWCCSCGNLLAISDFHFCNASAIGSRLDLYVSKRRTSWLSLKQLETMKSTTNVLITGKLMLLPRAIEKLPKQTQNAPARARIAAEPVAFGATTGDTM